MSPPPASSMEVTASTNRTAPAASSDPTRRMTTLSLGRWYTATPRIPDRSDIADFLRPLVRGCDHAVARNVLPVEDSDERSLELTTTFRPCSLSAAVADRA